MNKYQNDLKIAFDFIIINQFISNYLISHKKPFIQPYRLESSILCDITIIFSKSKKKEIIHNSMPCIQIFDEKYQLMSLPTDKNKKSK